MPWVQVIFGWPMIILTLAVFVAAFARERSALGFVGLILAVPFLWYSGHAPGGLWYSPTLLLALGAAARVASPGPPPVGSSVCGARDHRGDPGSGVATQR
jgi:hypothetical protein